MLLSGLSICRVSAHDCSKAAQKRVADFVWRKLRASKSGFLKVISRLPMLKRHFSRGVARYLNTIYIRIKVVNLARCS